MADYNEVNGYQNLMGSNTDYSDHKEYKVAGEIVPLRPNSPTVNDYAADRQKINERSMSNIAKQGPSGVDKTNLVMYPGKN